MVTCSFLNGPCRIPQRSKRRLFETLVARVPMLALALVVAVAALWLATWF
jgi:hypothetical protein